MNDLASLADRLEDFARKRNWERFHNPRNLATALAVEAAELLETFQWLTDEESAVVMDDPHRAAALRDECADVLIYLVRLADTVGIDLIEVANSKIDRNERRFPAI